MDIQDLLKFVEFTNKFNAVERKIYLSGTDKLERDGEHSFQLAIVSWYIINKLKLNLDIEKILKYCLVHDLVEAHAGDTPASDKKARETKQKREYESFIKIKEDFEKDFPEMISLMGEYEKKLDLESKFIYSLDKLLSPMNVYLEDGKSWTELYEKYDILETLEYKMSIMKDDDIKDLLEKIIEMLKDKLPDLF